MTKYHAEPIFVDGHRFASKAEARRYSSLKLLQRAGEIEDLELQPRYDIVVNGRRIGFYKADFKYTNCLAGETVIEDVKSAPTAKNPLYRLKKKLVEAIYGVTIVEVM